MREAEEVRDGFSARHDALSRRYHYRVLARAAPSPFERDRALWWPHASTCPRSRRAPRHSSVGRDFTAFTPAGGYHQRFRREVIAADWRREGELLTFEIEADSFMRHMNRVLVGTMSS